MKKLRRYSCYPKDRCNDLICICTDQRASKARMKKSRTADKKTPRGNRYVRYVTMSYVISFLWQKDYKKNNLNNHNKSEN